MSMSARQRYRIEVPVSATPTAHGCAMTAPAAIARDIRAAAADPRELAAVLRRLCATARPPDVLYLLPAVRNGLALSAERAASHTGTSGAAFRSQIAAIAAMHGPLAGSHAGLARLAAACLSAGILMAHEPHTEQHSALYAELQQLQQAAARAVHAFASEVYILPPALAATCGACASVLLTSKFGAASSDTTSWALPCLVAAVAALLREVAGQSALGQASMRQFGPAISSAFQLAVQGTGDTADVEQALGDIGRACLASSTTTAAAAALQREVTPYLWTLLSAARSLPESAAQATASEQPRSARRSTARCVAFWPAARLELSTEPATSSCERRAEWGALQRVAAAVLATASIVHVADQKDGAPQLGTLIATALSCFQRHPRAAEALLALAPASTAAADVAARCSQLPHALHGDLHGATGQAEMCSSCGAGQAALSVQLPVQWPFAELSCCHAGTRELQIDVSRGYASASFLATLAAVCVPNATDDGTAPQHVPGVVFDKAAAAAVPLVVSLCSAPAAEAREAGRELFRALIAHGAMQRACKQSVAVVALRCVHAQLAHCPCTVPPGEVRATLSAVAVAPAQPALVLACCQLVARRAGEALHSTEHGGASDAAETSKELAAALMVVLLHADPAVLHGLLGCLESVWEAAASVGAGRVIEGVIFEHLAHCHDHRKKPACVRWYHAGLRGRGRASL